MRRASCPGCHRRFTNLNLARHLAQTQNPRCRTIHERNTSYLPGVNPLVSNRGESESDSDFGPQTPLPTPETFHGDFFGDDYEDGDFPGPWSDEDSDSVPPQLQPDNVTPSTSDSGSESDSDPEWEPPSAAPPSEPSDDEMGDEHGRLLTAEERQNAQDTLWTAPFVEPFPNPQAGKVHSAMPRPGYERYGENIADGDGTPQNPYHPFASKVDWEFAKWAKLRGPGSTATTELLNIEGVSDDSIYLNFLMLFPDARHVGPFVQEHP